MIDKAGREWLYCMICRKRVPLGRWACMDCVGKELTKAVYEYAQTYTGTIEPYGCLYALKERDEQLPEWLSDFIAYISLREAVAIARKREKYKRQRP
jgi:hypothetical protein